MLTYKKISKLLMVSILPISCLAGDHHHHHHNTVAIVNVPSMICPSGYTLNTSKQCVGKEEIAPERTCPNGGILTDEFNCMKTTSPIMKCPFQYILVGENMCQRNVEVEPIAICPDGYTITDGQMCTGSKTVPPIKKCLEGILNELQTECILQKSVTPIGECPSSEYTLISNERCAREILYDCTPATMAYTTGHHGHHGHGGHGHHNNYVIPQKVVSRTCSKTESIPAKLICPEGSVKNPTGFDCLYTTISEPTITCSNGSMVGKGECIEVVTVPAELQCPKTEIKQVNEFYDGKLYSLKNTSNNITLKGIGYGSQYVYNQNDANYNQPKAIITRRLGKRGGGSHHHHYGYYPIQRTYVEPIITQEIPKKKCYETETVPGELTCPVGYFEKAEKGMCKSIVPSSLTCPPDSVLASNGYCMRTVIAQPTVISQQQEVIQTHGHHHH
ncbi:oocyst wall 8 [Cryptosporidium xiaoi]|uniref:Oocyst wall 8 n=1 Tax=Cryptosporidium xiaoi TaxID=659607 RepID=A0AAV9XZF7_9CRYT